MEIYILDPAYVRTTIVEQFESLIWTERYSDLSDFTLVVKDTQANRSQYKDGMMLTHNLTDRMMIVESRLREITDAGLHTLKIQGRGFESILHNRSVTPFPVDTATWKSAAPATLGWIATRLVNFHLVSGEGRMPEDVIPELYIADTTAGSTLISVAVELGNMFERVKSLCDSDKLGFRIQLLPTSPKLRFNVYKGRDLRHVVFSSTLDSLTSESHLHDISDYKNLAYVWGKDAKTNKVVATPGLSVYRTGIMRRVLHVDAGDIDPAESTAAVYEEQLKQRGLEALAEHNKVDIFDGQLTGLDPYEYRYSYSLGDVVTMMDVDNRKHTAIITEYIWSWDVNGLKAYPTFTATDEWD